MENLSFLIAVVVADLVKRLWFKNNPSARDLVIPVLVFVTNLLVELTKNLLAQPMPDIALTTLGGAGGATLASLGTHRSLRWVANSFWRK